MLNGRDKKLRKLISYILGHRPDEFGLVLDEEGFIGIKDLHKAIIEEDGWSYVRKSHILQLVNTIDRQRFEIRNNCIRANFGDTEARKNKYVLTDPPRILYYGTSRKSYPAILNNGIRPKGQKYAALFISPELALRVGHRRDSQPVLLTIHAKKAHQDGIIFYQAGELIYLVEHLTAHYFTGPTPMKQKNKPTSETPTETLIELPGSFFPDPKLDFKNSRKKGKKKDISWKRESKKYRKR